MSERDFKDIMKKIYFITFCLMCLFAANAYGDVPEANGVAERVKTVIIEGNQNMTFGSSPDEPASNLYALTVTDAEGNPISEEELNDFRVEWDIEGFKTENDQPGQYCDSYGAFIKNSKPSLETSFELRNVPMNFYGRMTAKLILGNRSFTAQKYVVALGNNRQPDSQVLPVGGYPTSFSDYPDTLVGSTVLIENHGQAQDVLFGRWIMAGSDSEKKAELRKDTNGEKFLRISAPTPKKSHMLAKAITPPTSLVVFTSKVRFHNPGAVMTLTSRFPFKSNVKIYTNPVTLRFDGHTLTLNDEPLSYDKRPAEIKTDNWYVVRLDVDKSDETCQVTVTDEKGNTIGKSERVKWKQGSKPDFFNIGFDDEASGTIDLAECKAEAPNAYAERYNTPVEKGVYQLVVTYQGELSAGYVNSDLAGYVLGYHDGMATDTLEIACPREILDLRIGADKLGVAKIADVQLTKLEQQEPKGKKKLLHIGDSTSAGDGSWARVLEEEYGESELADFCEFRNRGLSGRNLGTYYQQGKLAEVLRDINPGNIVMVGNNGTNGMNSTFEEDLNYYLDALEAMGAKIIINSYTPHGAVANYEKGFNHETGTFDSYRRDTYDVVARKVAAERSKSDPNYLGFVEIGKNADAIFNAYVADFKANGYASREEAAQAIIKCFKDHNHYNHGDLACHLMLYGYPSSSKPGIVEQIQSILSTYLLK